MSADSASRRIRGTQPRILVSMGDPCAAITDGWVMPVTRLRAARGGGDVLLSPRVRLDPTRRVLLVLAPTWTLRNDGEWRLAQAYRDALLGAEQVGWTSLALPGWLASGGWPIEDAVRVGLAALRGTPTNVTHIFVVTQSPRVLEAWAEILALR